MTLPNRPRYAARLNAFRHGLTKPTTADLIARDATVPGMDAADLTIPTISTGARPPRSPASFPTTAWR